MCEPLTNWLAYLRSTCHLIWNTFPANLLLEAFLNPNMDAFCIKSLSHENTHRFTLSRLYLLLTTLHGCSVFIQCQDICKPSQTNLISEPDFCSAIVTQISVWRMASCSQFALWEAWSRVQGSCLETNYWSNRTDMN